MDVQLTALVAMDVLLLVQDVMDVLLGVGLPVQDVLHRVQEVALVVELALDHAPLTALLIAELLVLVNAMALHHHQYILIN